MRPAPQFPAPSTYFLRLLSCEGKQAFDTYTLAAWVARRGARSRHEPASPYKCRLCGRFHIGKRPPKSATGLER